MIPSYIFSLSWLNLYVESESVVRIYLKARVHCQFSHLTSLSDDFLVQLQTTNAKIFHLRFALKFAWTYFIERQITYKNIGGDFFDFSFLHDLLKILTFLGGCVKIQNQNSKWLTTIRITYSFCVAMYAVTIPQVFTEGLWLNIWSDWITH